MGPEEMRAIGRFIDDVLRTRSDDVVERVSKEVGALAQAYPLYGAPLRAAGA
jgi:glycine/serine hydroxymethyltransferase